jgi:hypothetical protein
MLEDVEGHLGGDVKLPAQLADIGDPECADLGVADLDLLGGAERKGLVAEVRPGQRAQ